MPRAIALQSILLLAVNSEEMEYEAHALNCSCNRSSSRCDDDDDDDDADDDDVVDDDDDDDDDAKSPALGLAADKLIAKGRSKRHRSTDTEQHCEMLWRR